MRLVCMVCVSWLVVSASAQTPPLAIATDKTITLIFPFPVRHVDRGTKEVLVQPVKEADNILLVKAATKNFSGTNLSVLTSDGTVYSFPVNYSVNPSEWIYHLSVFQKASLSTYANGILDNPRTLRGLRDRSWEMVATIDGIYIRESVIYYQLQLDNQSPIDYDIELLRFYIRDNRKGKRTATQEQELTPLYVAGNTRQVKANSNCAIVVALDKFTIPDAKYLAVQVMEKNGGRHLLMKVRNKKIMQATTLPDLK